MHFFQDLTLTFKPWNTLYRPGIPAHAPKLYTGRNNTRIWVRKNNSERLGIHQNMQRNVRP